VPGTNNLNCFDLLLTATNNSALSNQTFHTLKCLLPHNVYDADLVIDMEFEIEFEFPKTFKEKFDTTLIEAFSIKDAYFECMENGIKGKEAVELSMNNHFEAIKNASQDFYQAVDFVNSLQDHIEHRLKQYTKCISKSTPNYLKYLIETYNRQLKQKLRGVLDDE
jgi:hypothetical protein